MKKFPFLVLFFLAAALTTASAQDVKSFNSASGFTGMAEMGVLSGTATNLSETYAVVSSSMRLFTGYRFHRLLAAGATVGSDGYRDFTLLPVALGLRGIFLNTRFSPFYSLDAGYGFRRGQNNGDRPSSHGGWMLNPALGIKASMSEKAALSLTFGYNSQRATHYTFGRSSQTEREFHFKRLSARLGFLF